MTTRDVPPPKPDIDEPPPILGTWRNVYLVVFAELMILVALFYLLTRTSS